MKRYDWQFENLVPREDGKWVRYEDYLATEVARDQLRMLASMLKSDNERLRNMIRDAWVCLDQDQYARARIILCKDAQKEGQ